MKVKYKKYTFEQIDKETARPTLCVIISAKYSGQSQNDTQTMTFCLKCL